MNKMALEMGKIIKILNLGEDANHYRLKKGGDNG